MLLVLSLFNLLSLVILQVTDIINSVVFNRWNP